MLNYVTNIVKLPGSKERIEEILPVVQNDQYEFGSVDFNKIILLPESLNNEVGGCTDHWLKANKVLSMFIRWAAQ